VHHGKKGKGKEFLRELEQASFINYLDWSDQGRPAWRRYLLTVVLTCILWLVLPLLVVILPRA
jgi:hypothetical protein